jgi:hypothetical protein
LVPVRKQSGLKAGAFSPTLLIPVATTETNGLYKPGLKAFFPPVGHAYNPQGTTKTLGSITYFSLCVFFSKGTLVCEKYICSLGYMQGLFLKKLKLMFKVPKFYNKILYVDNDVFY